MSHPTHDHCHHTATQHPDHESYVRDQVARCVQSLRDLGLRRTRALELVVEEMACKDKPITLAELANVPSLQQQCDPATIYRLVTKLEEHGLVRRLGLHVRSGYYSLIVPGKHHDYLVCTSCGEIQEIDMACPVHALEEELQAKTGFTKVYHELEFFGICPQCIK
jgi:Fur family transcriptional regulator, ferric uptake regulator